LIGFSLLFMLGLAFLAERLRLNQYPLFFCGGWMFFASYPLCEPIDWINFLPGSIAGYFYFGSGSNFPLFPWAGYVICGGVLGSYLAHHRSVLNSLKFSAVLAGLGLGLLAVYQVAKLTEAMIHLDGRLANSPPSLIFQRLGAVLILYAIVSRIAALLTDLPDIILLIGRNTLPIYIVHLVLLYGSAWNDGLGKIYGKSLTPWQSAGAALLIILMLIGVVSVVELLRISKDSFNKRFNAG
jgi:fucose 4-O-acetylase-like acetyltransferase